MTLLVEGMPPEVPILRVNPRSGSSGLTFLQRERCNTHAARQDVREPRRRDQLSYAGSQVGLGGLIRSCLRSRPTLARHQRATRNPAEQLPATLTHIPRGPGPRSRAAMHSWDRDELRAGLAW